MTKKEIKVAITIMYVWFLNNSNNCTKIAGSLGQFGDERMALQSKSTTHLIQTLSCKHKRFCLYPPSSQHVLLLAAKDDTSCSATAVFLSESCWTGSHRHNIDATFSSGWVGIFKDVVWKRINSNVWKWANFALTVENLPKGDPSDSPPVLLLNAPYGLF